MSDTSPWGVPPSDPGPTPAYQPPQQPPSYPPPTPPGGGWQPPRKGPSTAVILGVIGAVLLVVAAFVVTLVVASGDEKDPAPAAPEPTQSAPSPSESEPTESTPTEAETESAPPADGDVVTGDGYTFKLPGVGWTDATDEAPSLDPGGTIDTLVVLGSSVALAQSNIIVEALSAGPATSVDDLEGLWKRNLASSDDATPEDIDETTIAGERALGVEINDRVNEAGLQIKQVAYLVLHDGRQYSIGLTYSASGDAVSRGDFDKLLASWEWTS